MKFFKIFIFFILFSCMDQNPAPIRYGNIEDNNLRNNIRQQIVVEKKLDVPSNQAYNEHYSLENDLFYIDEKSIENDEKILSKNDKNFLYHEVIEGETIDFIANKYGTTRRDLININKLSPPYILEELQILIIPILNNTNKLSNTRVSTPITEPQLDLEKDNNVLINSIVNNGKIIIPFNQVLKDGNKNKGINISAKLKTNIRSIDGGVVVYSGFDRQLGNLIIIKSNSSDVFIAYANLYSLLLKKQDKILRNDVVGKVGQTGDVLEPQVYISVRKNNQVIDPIGYVKSKTN